MLLKKHAEMVENFLGQMSNFGHSKKISQVAVQTLGRIKRNLYNSSCNTLHRKMPCNKIPIVMDLYDWDPQNIQKTL